MEKFEIFIKRGFTKIKHGYIIINVKRKRKEAKKMTKITATNKKEFEEIKKEYRNKGFNFVTFGAKLAEMENENGDFVVIERR